MLIYSAVDTDGGINTDIDAFTETHAQIHMPIKMQLLSQLQIPNAHYPTLA